MQVVKASFGLDEVLTADDIKAVVELHLNEFQHVLIGQLGRSFVHYFYQRVIQKDGIFLVYRAEGKVVGFVCGLSNANSFYGMDFYVQVCLAFVKKLPAQPSLWRSGWGHIKRKTREEKTGNAELLSIVVSPDFRKKGIGRTLISHFDDSMKARGVASYNVYTDMEHSTGHRLYDALKFKATASFRIGSLNYKQYIRYL